MTHAKHIEQDLRRRILAGTPPERLTLGALAGEYEVSSMPVREALAALAEDKLLVRDRPGGRLRVDAAVAERMARDAGEIEVPERVDWDEQLADEAIRLSLQGFSGYLREEASAERLGISRSVVRSAFMRLAGRGIIEYVPRCGWRVHACSLEDMQAYLDVRELMELKALQLARPRLVDAELEKLLEKNSPTPRGKARLDDSVHEYWIERCENRYVRDFFERFAGFYWSIFRFAAVADADEAAKAAEHRAILRALLERDWRAAERALRQHIRGQQQTLTQVLARKLETSTQLTSQRTSQLASESASSED